MTSDQLRIGLKVQTNREFSGISAGSFGEIVEASNSWPENDSVAVQWNRHLADTLTDWFSFDDLQYLDIIPCPGCEACLFEGDGSCEA